MIRQEEKIRLQHSMDSQTTQLIIVAIATFENQVLQMIRKSLKYRYCHENHRLIQTHRGHLLERHN